MRKDNVIQKEPLITIPPFKEITDQEINDTYRKFELYRFQSNLSQHQKEMTNHIYGNLKTSFALVQKEEPPYLKEQAIMHAVFYDTAKKYYDIKEDSPLDHLKSLNDIAFYSTEKFMSNPNYYIKHDNSVLLNDAQKIMEEQYRENAKVIHVLQKKNPEIPQNVHQVYVETLAYVMMTTNSKISDNMKDQVLSICERMNNFIEKNDTLSKIDEKHKEVLLNQSVLHKIRDTSLSDEKSMTQTVKDMVKLEQQIEKSIIFEKQKQLERGFER